MLKVEFGELLLSAWLRQVKECQLAQPGWVAEPQHGLAHAHVMDALLRDASSFFADNYGYSIHQHESAASFIKGAPTIAVGVRFDNQQSYLYGIDLVFAGAGLNPSHRMAAVSGAVAKCIRGALSLYGHFGLSLGSFILASPTIHPAVVADLAAALRDVESLFAESGVRYTIQLIANEDFHQKILQPVLMVQSKTSEADELFTRSMQLCNVFFRRTAFPLPGMAQSLDAYQKGILQAGELGAFEEMSTSIFVRTIIRRELECGSIPSSQIRLLEDREYCWRTFGLLLPVLLEVKGPNALALTQYYAEPLQVHGTWYVLCSDWDEEQSTQVKAALLQWISRHTSRRA